MIVPDYSLILDMFPRPDAQSLPLVLAVECRKRKKSELKKRESKLIKEPEFDKSRFSYASVLNHSLLRSLK